MTVRIRRMVASDVDGVAALADGLPTAPHWSRESYLAALNSEAKPSRIALVAEIEQELAGLAIASLVPPQAELESIAVASQFQRRGIARRLLAALVGELGQAGADELLLEVRESNQAAVGFYRALGLEPTGSRPAYYDNPTEAALLLRKPLT